MPVVEPHSHVWMDPTEPPIARAQYSPVIGPGRYEMRLDREYRCRVCFERIRPADVLAKAGIAVKAKGVRR